MRKRCWCLCFENRDVVVSDPLKQVVLPRVDLLLEKHLPTGQLLVRKWKIFKAKADFEIFVFVSLVWYHLGQRKSLFRVHYRVLQALREKNWQKLFQLHYTQNSTNVIELRHVTRPEPKEQSHPSGFAAVPLDQLPIKYWIFAPRQKKNIEYNISKSIIIKVYIFLGEKAILDHEKSSPNF